MCVVQEVILRLLGSQLHQLQSCMAILGTQLVQYGHTPHTHLVVLIMTVVGSLQPRDHAYVWQVSWCNEQHSYATVLKFPGGSNSHHGTIDDIAQDNKSESHWITKVVEGCLSPYIQINKAYLSSQMYIHSRCKL